MKKNALLIFSLFLFLFISCDEESEPVLNCYTESDPPRNSQNVTIEQGVWGDVWFWSGNFMPPGRGEICQVVRKVLVYELTTREDVDKVDYTPFYTAIHTKLISSVVSDNLGFFQIELEPGTYSLFVQEDNEYYSNLYSSQGIFPVTIESGKVSEVRFDITYEAVY
jgi:hypothetical protein